MTVTTSKRSRPGRDKEDGGSRGRLIPVFGKEKDPGSLSRSGSFIELPILRPSLQRRIQIAPAKQGHADTLAREYLSRDIASNLSRDILCLGYATP